MRTGTKCLTANLPLRSARSATTVFVRGAAVPASAYGAAVAVGLLFAVALTAVALVQPVVQMLRRDPQETLTRGDM